MFSFHNISNQIFKLLPFLCLCWLTACDSATLSTATPVVTPSPVVSAGITPTFTTINLATSIASQTAPVAQPVTNTPPLSVPATTTSSTPNELLFKSAQLWGETTSYSFSVTQTAILQNGASNTLLKAIGNGIFASSTFSQTFTLEAGGVTQPIEIFLQNGQSYQKISNLKVWRKLNPNAYKWAVYEPPQLVQTATNVAAQGPEDVEGIHTLKYMYSITGTQLYDSANGVGLWPLGLLSVSQILNGFQVDDLKAATLLETVWLDPLTLLPVQRQVTLEVKNNVDNQLSYQAIYIYRHYNQPDIKIDAPPNLPNFNAK